MIPFKKIDLGNAYKEIEPLFKSGKIGLGQVTGQFEKELAEYVGSKYALAVSSCTAALFISSLWEKMHGAEEVSIPSMTMALVPMAILQAGLKIDKFNDDVAWVGDRYRIFGTDIIDSAHRLRRNDFEGLAPQTKLCYSFYPTKVIGSIDGGAIATNDEEFIKWARSYILYGRNQGKEYKNSWEYEIEMLGGKYNYNDVQAAICLEQLRRLDDTNADRRHVAEVFNNNLHEHNTSDYLYRIQLNNRDGFIRSMARQGIECGVHFKPLHLFKPFKDIPVDNKEKIEFEYKQTVSLPFYESLTNQEIYEICRQVSNWEYYQNAGV